jgi:hypothetical protein
MFTNYNGPITAYERTIYMSSGVIGIVASAAGLITAAQNFNTASLALTTAIAVPSAILGAMGGFLVHENVTNPNLTNNHS